MTVRRRVIVLAVTCLVLAGLMIGLMTAGLWIADHTARRTAGIHGRLDVLSQLSIKASQYGDRAAEMLQPGRDGSDELDAARIGIEMLLSRLTQATRAEIATLSGMDEVQGELPELEGARRIIELYHAIDAAMKDALSLRRDGQTDAANDVLQRSVSFRLTNELLPLLEVAAKEERQEVEIAIEKVGGLAQPLFIGATLAGVLGLAAIVAMSVGLWRAIVGPIGALSRQARALAAGEEGAAPATRAPAEFAPLAESLEALRAAVAGQLQSFTEAGERLASEVDARTAQLRAANEQLREIDRRRGQFLTDVSHELRTPLTILRGEADVALRGQDDPQLQRQSLERIQGQAAELGQLLEDLIEFARSAAEDQPFVMTDTQLDEVVSAAALEAGTLASPREVTIALELDDGGRHIDADFRRLKQALMVGLDNAIKHSPPGTKVTVSTSVENGYARISIADEGSGVDERDLPRVFERFFRGRDEADTLASGLGIGLAIAKDIVERHGGSIGLANRSAGGAALSILLPLGGRNLE